MKGLELSTITPQDSKSEDMNQNNIENSNESLWAQPIEEHGQLFSGLNLDGIGDHDDEAYVSLYVWDHNGFYRYDVSELVVRIKFGTGDTTAHIEHEVGSYQFYETDPFPSVVERLNTTGEVPILSADGEKLYEGSLILGTTITDIDNKPMQGIVLHSSGDGYSGPIGGRESQTIYWNGKGWIVLERSESKYN